VRPTQYLKIIIEMTASLNIYTAGAITILIFAHLIILSLCMAF